MTLHKYILLMLLFLPEKEQKYWNTFNLETTLVITESLISLSWDMGLYVSSNCKGFFYFHFPFRLIHIHCVAWSLPYYGQLEYSWKKSLNDPWPPELFINFFSHPFLISYYVLQSLSIIEMAGGGLGGRGGKGGGGRRVIGNVRRQVNEPTDGRGNKAWEKIIFYL